MTDGDLARLGALAELGYTNPFGPERIALERAVLGGDFIETGYAWHKDLGETAQRPNIERLTHFALERAGTIREALSRGAPAGEALLGLYENAVLYGLYNRYESRFHGYLLDAERAGGASGALGWYDEWRTELAGYLALPGLRFASMEDPAHLFACLFQVRRAFHHIYEHIIGGSAASARLRMAVWESIFTCDMRRYRRGLYGRMGDITTLITGPSGTGKELVARAVGLSRYIAFDAKSRGFTADYLAGFRGVNLSALSPTLIESELFGHRKGAFTGAIADRAGYLEECPAHGCIFLDELGELDPAVQVKLLRVLQTRTFQRIGDTAERSFRGKIVAATNRDLAAEMAAGRFRQDLYYRLNADAIATPSLAEQVRDAPEQLRNLLRFVSRRIAGADEAEALIAQAERWIGERLGADYPWPGNVRELEQCVRNILVRNAYYPPSQRPRAADEAFLEAVREGGLDVASLLTEYITRHYARTGNYVETARRLGVDRRTVKAKVDEALLARLSGAN